MHVTVQVEIPLDAVMSQRTAADSDIKLVRYG
jgi:hypothetical protein